MSTTMKQFRLPEDTIRQLDNLKANTGLSEVEIVKQAIAAMFAGETSISKRIDIIYQAVNNQTEQLEGLRDYDRELTEQETAFYNWLNKAWQELRGLPGFWEPRLIENELNDYVLDENGEPIPDLEHEKTRPKDM